MKNHVGFETSQRHTEQTPAELPNEAVRMVRIGTSAHLLQLGLWEKVRRSCGILVLFSKRTRQIGGQKVIVHKNIWNSM